MRYLPSHEKSRKAMMDKIGIAHVDALYKDVPKSAFISGLADMPLHQGELEVERQLSSYANQNRAAGSGPFFLGAGCYYHHVPSSVDYIIQRSEFLTAYTPYQPEIAQGTLAAIYEFQTYIALLTGQDVANASMYDGATATAEAALMAMRVTKRGKAVVGTALHPHYREVLETYLGNHEGAEIAEGAPDAQTACLIVQSPDFFGKPHAYEAFRRQCDETGAMLVVVVTEIVSLGLLPAPAQADIVCGEAQSIGLPMSFGGPHLGFFATKDQYVRQMPGRLCGQTVDAKGRRGFVLTLNTREQHIRREKATSNICTNQGLCALAFTVHMSLLGEDGFRRLALLNHEAACRFAEKVEAIDGVSLVNNTFFNEICLHLPKKAAEIVKLLGSQGITAGFAAGEDLLLCAVTEMTRDADMDRFCKALEGVLRK